MLPYTLALAVRQRYSSLSDLAKNTKGKGPAGNSGTAEQLWDRGAH